MALGKRLPNKKTYSPKILSMTQPDRQYLNQRSSEWVALTSGRAQPFILGVHSASPTPNAATNYGFALEYNQVSQEHWSFSLSYFPFGSLGCSKFFLDLGCFFCFYPLCSYSYIDHNFVCYSLIFFHSKAASRRIIGRKNCDFCVRNNLIFKVVYFLFADASMKYNMLKSIFLLYNAFQPKH